MPNFVYHYSNITIFIFVFLILTLLSVISIFLIKKYINEELLYKDNDMIGYVSCTIGLVFAVLTGFTILFLFNQFDKAGDLTQTEAGMVIGVYERIAMLPKPIQPNIQEKVKSYVQTVVFEEWPAMSKGESIGPKGMSIIKDIKNYLINFKTTGKAQSLVLQDIINQVNNLYTARLQRILMVEKALGSDVWFTIILTTILTLAIHYFYGLNIWLHLMSTIAVVAVISALLFLMVAMDHPFQGEFCVTSDAFTQYPEFSSLTSLPTAT